MQTCINQTPARQGSGRRAPGPEDLPSARHRRGPPDGAVHKWLKGHQPRRDEVCQATAFVISQASTRPVTVGELWPGYAPHDPHLISAAEGMEVPWILAGTLAMAHDWPLGRLIGRAGAERPLIYVTSRLSHGYALVGDAERFRAVYSRKIHHRILFRPSQPSSRPTSPTTN